MSSTSWRSVFAISRQAKSVSSPASDMEDEPFMFIISLYIVSIHGILIFLHPTISPVSATMLLTGSVKESASEKLIGNRALAWNEGLAPWSLWVTQWAVWWPSYLHSASIFIRFLRKHCCLAADQWHRLRGALGDSGVSCPASDDPPLVTMWFWLGDPGPVPWWFASLFPHHSAQWFFPEWCSSWPPQDLTLILWRSQWAVEWRHLLWQERWEWSVLERAMLLWGTTWFGTATEDTFCTTEACLVISLHSCGWVRPQPIQICYVFD